MVKEYIIQQLVCGTWEDVSTYDTKADAQADLARYRENQPEYPARVIIRRTKGA